VQVAATLTPSSAPVVAGALIWAYQQVTGRPPPARTSWEIPLAQSADETGNWSALTLNNVGFISQPNASLPWFYRGSNPVKFAAYPTLGQGCVALMKWLQRTGALAAADNGDMAGYAAGLKAGNYLGTNGDYTTYANTIANIVPTYTNLVPVPYNEGGGGLAVAQRLSNPKALAFGVGILTLAAVAAYAIHPKPRRARARGYA
jgi:hypothetical protein